NAGDRAGGTAGLWDKLSPAGSLSRCWRDWRGWAARGGGDKGQRKLHALPPFPAAVLPRSMPWSGAAQPARVGRVGGEERVENLGHARLSRVNQKVVLLLFPGPFVVGEGALLAGGRHVECEGGDGFPPARADGDGDGVGAFALPGSH